MRAFTQLVTALATTWITPVTSQSTSSSAGDAALAQMAEALPPCALNCLATLIPQSPCSVTDLACICTNVQLNQQSAICLASNCTVKESLATEKYQKSMCGAPIRDKTSVVPAVNWSLYPIALLSVVFRFWARSSWGKGAGLWWDDYSILLCIVLFTAGSSVTTRMAILGLGKDMWTLPPHNITTVLMYFWIDEFLYIALLATSKISILFLYLRIFPATVSTWFRIGCFILMGVSLAYFTIYFFIILFSCEPLEYFWHQWDGEHTGSCINTNAEIYSSSALNIVLDLCVLILPIPRLLKLEVSLPKKLGICLTFSVGLFSVICSVIRLNFLVKWGDTTNPTWDYTNIAVWSTVEGAAVIICACMPQMAGPIKRAYQRSIGRLSSLGSRKYDSSGAKGSDGVELARARRQVSHENGIKKTLAVSAVYDGSGQEVGSVEELIGKPTGKSSTSAKYGHDFSQDWQ